MSHARAVAQPWACPSCGNGPGDACGRLTPGTCRIDAELVVHRLERAGETLLAMRLASPYPTQVRSGMPEVLREWEAYGWSTETVRPACPSSCAISAMDATYRWLSVFPHHRRVLRRIVAVRSLVSPTTGRHVCSWRRLGTIIGADYQAVQRWHGQGIELIVQAVAGGLYGELGRHAAGRWSAGGGGALGRLRRAGDDAGA